MEQTIDHQQTNPSVKPALELTDGAMKAVIWKNEREGKLPWYNVTFAQSYKGADGHYHDRRSFTGVELRRLSRLAERAYEETSARREADRQYELTKVNMS